MTWERWKQLPLWGRGAMLAMAALILYEFVLALAAPLGGGGSGAGRTSFSARPNGLGVWADLLSSAGHEVTRAKTSVSDIVLPANGTVIIPGRQLDADEIADLELFVMRGGRVVVAGSQATRTLAELLDDTVRFQSAPSDAARSVVPVPETAGVDQEVGPHPVGHWSDTGPALPIVANEDEAFVAVADVGQGRVVMVADLTPLENQWIGDNDNAQLAVGLAGEPERMVVFAEAGSGGGEGSGLAAIPSRWRWALIAGGIATLLAMWSAGRRFGPPEAETRDLPPPRRAYVDALAATLAKGKRPSAAVAPLREAARERLIRRAALAPDATVEQLRAAAVELGLAPEEIEAVLGRVDNEQNALAVGRAMARLGGNRW